MNFKYLKPFIILTIIAGAIGVSIPETKTLFLDLTPIYLWLLGAFCIYIFPEKNANTISLLLLISIAAWLIEVNGVSTGLIFGEYRYGPILGLKILNVPITIGLLWLVLLLGSSAVTEEFIPHAGIFTKAAVSAGFMTVLDIFIEPVAISLNYWNWEGNTIPTRNFIAWWIISFLLHWFIIKYQLNIKSSIYRLIFVLQFIFFLGINLINSIFF